MKKQIQKYAGVLLMTAVVITGVAKAANVDPIPSIINTFAVSGQVITSVDLNKLAEGLNILDGRTNNFKNNISVTDAGNVGVGTLAPDQRLTLNGNMRIAHGGYHEVLYLGENENSIINDDSADKHYGGGFFFRVSNPDNSYYHDVMMLSETGNVGIGVPPREKLDVAGKINVDATAEGDKVYLFDGQSATTTQTGLKKILGGGVGVFDYAPGSPSSHSFSVFKRDTYDDQGSDVMLMTVQKNGNVGIGTATPEAKLTVAGSPNMSSIVINSPLNKAKLYNFDNDTTTSFDISGSANSDTRLFTIHSGGATQGSAFNGSIFEVHGHNGLGHIPALSVQNAGNVGMGTGSPAEKLQVVGNVFVGDGSAINSITSRSGSAVKTDNIQAISNEGLRLYDDNSNSYLNIQAAGNVSLQAYNPSAANFQTMQDASNYSNLLLNRDGGNVGIGTATPSEKLEVVGNVKATAFLNPSDERLKKNIQPLENVLEKVAAMKGVSFEWKNNGKHDIGLIAQDVQAQFPEAVSVGADGYLAVDYSRMVPVLLEAIKEQQKFSIAQQKEIDDLRCKLGDCK